VHGTIESLTCVEWRPLAELDGIAGAWRALAARALAPNVFYEPAFALAAAPALGRDVGAGLVWSQSTPAQLLGFFPARIERRRYGVPLPILVGWTHPYGPLGAPLVDRDVAQPVIAAWLEHVAGHAQLPKMLLLPFFPDNPDDALLRALDAVVARRGGSSVSFGRHRRALLVTRGAAANGGDDAVGGKKRKELRRQRKRLGETGSIAFSRAGNPAAVTQALSDFMSLEAGGWKGRAGTAAREHPAIAAFMTAAVTALAGEGKAWIARLAVDARAIAAMVMLRSGPTDTATVWAWKIAYDESYARFSPGVQVLLDATKVLRDDPTVAGADSCAGPDHPMIDHVWRGRLTLADRLIAVGPSRSFGFALARRLERLRRAAIGAAKALRSAVRHRA
jgi:CelD/BcsL family acetyltransferase involved in cellulose biosynthesis